MKSLLAVLVLLFIASLGLASHASANPLDPYNPAPICKNGFVPTQIPDGTWRCLPRYH